MPPRAITWRVRATLSLTVNKATPAITWARPADISYGTALSGTQLDASTSVPGSFSYSPAAGTVLAAGSDQTLTVRLHPRRHDRLHHGHGHGADRRRSGRDRVRRPLRVANDHLRPGGRLRLRQALVGRGDPARPGRDDRHRRGHGVGHPAGRRLVRRGGRHPSPGQIVLRPIRSPTDMPGTRTSSPPSTPRRRSR